jgi:hypothetical protein
MLFFETPGVRQVKMSLDIQKAKKEKARWKPRAYLMFPSCEWLVYLVLRYFCYLCYEKWSKTDKTSGLWFSVWLNRRTGKAFAIFETLETQCDWCDDSEEEELLTSIGLSSR